MQAASTMAGGHLGPLHDAHPRAVPLRFFPAPSDPRQLPWHSVDDLLRCTGMPRVLRRFYRAMLVAEWSVELVMLTTPDGKTLIAPNPLGHVLLRVLIENGRIGSGYVEGFALATGRAFAAMHEGFSELAVVERLVEAFRRTYEVPAPLPPDPRKTH